MTGTGEYSAASLAAPSLGCLTTITSAYAPTTRTVSARDSPLDTDEALTSHVEMAPPPSLWMAASNERRVRVLGS